MLVLHMHFRYYYINSPAVGTDVKLRSWTPVPYVRYDGPHMAESVQRIRPAQPG